RLLSPSFSAYELGKPPVSKRGTADPQPQSVRPPQSGARLIGRDHEVEQVAALFAAHRLVTLAGMGGVGKTRLAASLAWKLEPAFTGGSVWVDLADAVREEEVTSAVARSLGLRQESGRGLEAALIQF